jgi:hypothetical protein
MYALPSPTENQHRDGIAINLLSQRQAILLLIANTFNTRICEPARLARQFNQATLFAAGIPVKSLFYPRDLSRLPDVLKAVQADVK